MPRNLSVDVFFSKKSEDKKDMCATFYKSVYDSVNGSSRPVVMCEAYHDEEYEFICPFCQKKQHMLRRDIESFSDLPDFSKKLCSHVTSIYFVQSPCYLQRNVVLVSFSHDRHVYDCLHDTDSLAALSEISKFSSDERDLLKRLITARSKNNPDKVAFENTDMLLACLAETEKK